MKPFIDTTLDTESSNTSGFSFSSFVNRGDDLSINIGDEIETKPPKKRGRPKKKDKDIKTVKLNDGAELIEENYESEDLKMYESNRSYVDMFDDTSNMLKETIGQIDVLSYSLQEDFNRLRSSKTLRNKQKTIADTAATLSQLIGTKITAIKEINKTKVDGSNLDLKRMKDLKIMDDDKDDDKAVMDMYNAFISAPMGDDRPTMLSANNLLLPGSGLPLMGSNIGDANYNDYAGNISSINNRMRYERDPNVKTVVVYNQETGARYFDVMNVMTGESIPNVDRPDSMFLEDTTLDLNSLKAVNTNLNTDYDIILVGQGAVNKY